MSSKKKREIRGKHKETSGNVITASNVPKLKRDCQKVFQTLLNDSSVGLTERRLGFRSSYSLVGAAQTNARAHDLYSVLPFFESKTDFYWIAATIDFSEQAKQTILENVTIILFKGLAVDGEKVPLIRIEWSFKEDDAKALHAQPHWHVYPSSINRDLEQYREFIAESESSPKEFTGVTEFGESSTDNSRASEWLGSEKIHFAMVSRWHEEIWNTDKEGPTPHHGTMQIDKLAQWLEGCLRYLLHQLEYVYK